MAPALTVPSSALGIVAGAVLCAASLQGCYVPHREDPDQALALWRASATEPRPSSPASSGASRSAGEASMPEGPLSLTPDAAVRRALRGSGRLHARRLRALAARAQVRRAGQLENPELRVGEARFDELDQEDAVEVGLRVPIPRPGVRGARMDAARQEAAAEEALEERARGDLRTAVRRAHADLLLHQAEQALSQGRVALDRERVELLAARLRRGETTEAVLARAELRLAVERDKLRVRTEERSASEARLAGLVGQPAGRSVHAAPGEDPAEDPLLARDPKDLVKLALHTRPELRAAAARVHVAEARRWVAKTRAFPWFDFVQLSYHAGPGAGADNWGLMLGLELPIFQVNGGERDLRAARLRQRLAEERALVGEVAREALETLNRARRARRRLEEIRAELIKAGERQVRAVERAVAAGTADTLDLIQARGRLLDARRRALRARWALATAVIRLRAAVGWPPRPSSFRP